MAGILLQLLIFQKKKLEYKLFEGRNFILFIVVFLVLSVADIHKIFVLNERGASSKIWKNIWAEDTFTGSFTYRWSH